MRQQIGLDTDADTKLALHYTTIADSLLTEADADDALPAKPALASSEQTGFLSKFRALQLHDILDQFRNLTERTEFRDPPIQGRFKQRVAVWRQQLRDADKRGPAALRIAWDGVKAKLTDEKAAVDGQCAKEEPTSTETGGSSSQHQGGDEVGGGGQGKSDHGIAGTDDADMIDVHAVWTVENMFDQLCYELFDTRWEARHGAAMALTRIWLANPATAAEYDNNGTQMDECGAPTVRSAGNDAASVGDEATGSTEGSEEHGGSREYRRVGDVLARCLAVLCLERFADYGGGGAVVVPVQEACGQLLGLVCTRELPFQIRRVLYSRQNGPGRPPGVEHGVGDQCEQVLEVLEQIAMEDQAAWFARHGAYIGIRCIMAAAATQLEQMGREPFSRLSPKHPLHAILTSLPQLWSLCVQQGLQDRDGEVRSAAAAAARQILQMTHTNSSIALSCDSSSSTSDSTDKCWRSEGVQSCVDALNGMDDLASFGAEVALLLAKLLAPPTQPPPDHLSHTSGAAIMPQSAGVVVECDSQAVLLLLLAFLRHRSVSVRKSMYQAIQTIVELRFNTEASESESETAGVLATLHACVSVEHERSVEAHQHKACVQAARQCWTACVDAIFGRACEPAISELSDRTAPSAGCKCEFHLQLIQHWVQLSLMDRSALLQAARDGVASDCMFQDAACMHLRLDDALLRSIQPENTAMTSKTRIEAAKLLAEVVARVWSTCRTHSHDAALNIFAGRFDAWLANEIPSAEEHRRDAACAVFVQLFGAIRDRASSNDLSNEQPATVDNAGFVAVGPSTPPSHSSVTMPATAALLEQICAQASFSLAAADPVSPPRELTDLRQRLLMEAEAVHQAFQGKSGHRLQVGD